MSHDDRGRGCERHDRERDEDDHHRDRDRQHAGAVHFLPRARCAEPVSRILGRALKSDLLRRLHRRVPAAAWNAAVGPALSARAQPSALSPGGVLHVLVQDHRWRDQIDALRALIVERLNARLRRPLVRELRFGLAHAGALKPAEPAQVREPAHAASPPLDAGRLPPELRDALLRAAHAFARRRARA